MMTAHRPMTLNQEHSLIRTPMPRGGKVLKQVFNLARTLAANGIAVLKVGEAAIDLQSRLDPGDVLFQCRFTCTLAS